MNWTALTIIAIWFSAGIGAAFNGDVISFWYAFLATCVFGIMQEIRDWIGEIKYKPEKDVERFWEMVQEFKKEKESLGKSLEIIQNLTDEEREINERKRREEDLTLTELVDSAYEIIFSHKVESPAQIEWKEKWLSSAKKYGAGFDV